MQNTQVFSVDCEKTILTSKSLFYKTENFIKQTKHISNLDILLSKLCESIVFNIDKIDLNNLQNAALSCFSLETLDGNFRFLFKLGYQINNQLNKYDIVFFNSLNANIQQNIRVDEYVSKNAKVDICIKQEKNLVKSQDFNKLYLISNISNVNLPKLNAEQKEIVETVDKNILVQGVAGSGKTNICIDKIIFSACKGFGGKVLYTTFSRGLLVDTKLKIERYKKDLEKTLKDYYNNKILFLDDDHKKALENKLGIYFFNDDTDKIFEKVQQIIDYLTNKVDYFLIEDIYKNKFGECLFSSENYFVNSYSKNLSNHQIEKCFLKLDKYSKEIIYKEIYGMLFGYYSLENKQEILPLDSYISKRQNSFSKQECENIYQIAIDYKKHCQKNNLIDNNIASKKIIDSLDNNFEYSLAIIDEVQDYTQANLCLFKKLSLKLFCVGDALQMINPTYFNFGYLKNLLYEKDLTEVRELKNNYRNSFKIAQIIDNLSVINKQEFGTHNFVLQGQSIDNGLKTTAVYLTEEDIINQISTHGFEDITIVVCSQEQKKQLKNIVKNQEILTVSEIKGLERNTVVLYDLLSTNIQKWQSLELNKINHKQADENSVFRYYYNLFYVGLSRAKQNIFVLETKQINQFKDFFSKNFLYKNAKDSVSCLNEIVSRSEFSQKEVVERVEEFIRLEQFDNARFTANKIKDDLKRIDYLRTIDIYENYIHFGKYREAGIKFWEYGLTEQAKTQFRLSNDQILIELVDKCSQTNNSDLNIEIVKYFEDVKDNKTAQSFIIDTVKKDIKKLKESFYTINQNFKKVGKK